MRPSLIIFIDCFPHGSLTDDFLPVLKGRAGTRPGFGYSVNIMAELFAGKTPDDLGTLNIFNLNPDSTWLSGWGRGLALLAPLEHAYLADRMAHRLLSRVAGYVGNIPFRYIQYFEPSGIYPFAPEFPHRTVFSDPRFRGTTVFHSDLKDLRAPHRDAELVRRTRRAIREGESTFLSLSDLDAQAHAHGVGSAEFLQRIHDYNVWLTDLIDRFMTVNPDGYVAVLSDHGAVNTVGTHDLGVEKHFGRAAPGRYMYFLDATLARFWVPEGTFREEMEQFLRETSRGHLVTEAERKEYGLSSRSLGDLIWVVDEGYGISPSFLGRGLSHALHGYHPALPSQSALFLSSEPVSQASLRSLEVYRTLDQHIYPVQEREQVLG